jgi:hypothetical protein
VGLTGSCCSSGIAGIARVAGCHQDVLWRHRGRGIRDLDGVDSDWPRAHCRRTTDSRPVKTAARDQNC